MRLECEEEEEEVKEFIYLVKVFFFSIFIVIQYIAHFFNACKIKMLVF